MPPHILALFEARPPLEHLPFADTTLRRKPGGMAQYVKEFSDEIPVPQPHFETPKERRARKNKEKIEAHLLRQKNLIEQYDPKSGNSLTHDPYKTLFIGNLAYEATERQLRSEFEAYGKIKRIRIIADANGNPRGYAFIEFDTEREMVNAYKRGDGRKIAGRRVIVDVERSRTVAGWLPRRLGGGRGLARGSKKNIPPVNINANPVNSSRGYSQPRNSTRSYSQSRSGYGRTNSRYDYSSRSACTGRSDSMHTERREYNNLNHSNPENTRSSGGSSHYGENFGADKYDDRRNNERRRGRSEDKSSDRRDRSYDRDYGNERDYKRHHI